MESVVEFDVKLANLAREFAVESNVRLANLGVLLEKEICTVPSLCRGYSCLQDAAISINALARTNVMLNKSINQDDKALALIKQLSQQFDCANIDVARVLCTQAANNRWALQEAFRGKWGSHWAKVEKDVEKLYSIGLDLNFSYSKTFRTSLLQIVSWQEAGYANMGLWLIKKGADITCCTPDGINASMIALRDYNHTLIDALIDHPACNVNHQDNDNNTMLHYCFRGAFVKGFGMRMAVGRLSCVYKTIEKLLEKGANPTVINSDGYAPLDWAIELDQYIAGLDCHHL
jgi:hypothetical protein